MAEQNLGNVNNRFIGTSVVFSPTDSMGNFHKLLSKLNDKAKAFGLDPVEVVSQQSQLYRHQCKEVKDGAFVAIDLVPATRADIQDGGVDLVELQRIEITNPLIKLGNWRVVGKLENEPISGQQLSFSVSREPPDNDAIDVYRSHPISCEHCHTKRRRGQSYVLANDQGEYKQVGTACLEDFTGISPERLLFLATFNRFVKTYDPDDEAYNAGQRRVVGTQSYLADVSFLSGVGGFISATKAREGYGLSPTYADALQINALLRGNDSLRERYVHERPLHKERAAKVIAWFSEQTNPVDSFTRNVQILIGNEVIAIENRHLAFAAAAVPAYTKAMQEQRMSLSGPLSQYQGVLGEKIERSLTIEKIVPLESRFGNPYLILMRDAEGNAYKWKAASPAVEIIEAEGLDLKASMKVKAHEEYKGVPQTSVSHLKVLAWENVNEQVLRILEGDKLLANRRSRDIIERLVPVLDPVGAQQVKEAIFKEMKASWPGEEWEDELAKVVGQRDRYHSDSWGYIAENDTDRYLMIGNLNRRLDELGFGYEVIKTSSTTPAPPTNLPQDPGEVDQLSKSDLRQSSFSF
jgi:hypothetical protein